MHVVERRLGRGPVGENCLCSHVDEPERVSLHGRGHRQDRPSLVEAEAIDLRRQIHDGLLRSTGSSPALVNIHNTTV